MDGPGSGTNQILPFAQNDRAGEHDREDQNESRARGRGWPKVAARRAEIKTHGPADAGVADKFLRQAQNMFPRPQGKENPDGGHRPRSHEILSCLGLDRSPVGPPGVGLIPRGPINHPGFDPTRLKGGRLEYVSTAAPPITHSPPTVSQA